MSSMSEDIQCAGSDTRPPMLDRTDFESWQQRIRLYCLGKDNGENIMKSITEGPFQMGTMRDTLTEGGEGALHLGPERARVFADLSAEQKDRYKADIRATNILLQGIPKDIYTLINHFTDAKDIWDNVKMILEGSELTKDDRESQLYDEFEHFCQIKGETIHVYYYSTQSSKSPQSSNEPSPANNFQLDSRSSSTENLIESLSNSLALLTQSYKSHLPQINNQLRTSSNARNKATVQDGRVVDSDYFKDKMLLMNAHENGAVLDEEQLLFLAGEQVTNLDDDVDDLALNVDHVFEADQCDVFESDVDEAPTTQTITRTYSDCNIIRISVMWKDTQEHIVANYVSSLRNDALMSILDEMHEQGAKDSPPPDYSKENLLATFAPQRNLTPEQIFWSIDENDRKKAETSVPKPLSALTVYPPNTPVKLVPRVLPTKSQVKINLYVLTQLFTEFDKTCKKRITPTGVTEGERGFEQTKRCYLTEVIPFFKTLKEHFARVQTALFKEVKVMEEIFDQMNDEVDQNTVDKQCAEIVKKNLLIEKQFKPRSSMSKMTSVHNSSGLKPQCQMTFDYNRSSLDPQCQTTFQHNGSSLDSQCNRVHHKCSETEQHHNELDCYSVLCSTIIFNGENKLFKVFRCHYTDASNKRQQQPDSTSSTLTLATTVTANGNFDL
ncbi:hypothetical protein Tco_1256811 [Tanacetum coccineum]